MMKLRPRCAEDLAPPLGGILAEPFFPCVPTGLIWGPLSSSDHSSCNSFSSYFRARSFPFPASRWLDGSDYNNQKSVPKATWLVRIVQMAKPVLVKSS